jgi:hypothetical protein
MFRLALITLTGVLSACLLAGFIVTPSLGLETDDADS